MAADLHCHTRMSDGSTSINEIVLLAKGKNLKTIAVADHDTFAGSTRAKIFGDRHGVEVISCIEISGFDYDRNNPVHILGYCCESPDRLEGLCKKIQDSRSNAVNIMIQKVMRLYPISSEMILRRAQGSSNVFKQHIMHALMDAGYTNEIYGPLFNKLFDGKRGFAYSAVTYPDVYEVIDQIHAAGGLVVMAHPGKYNGKEILYKLAESGLIDGIEVWHPTHTEEDNYDFSELAKKHNLIMTGGTDFHGMYTKNPIPIGTVTAPDEQVLALKKRKVVY